MLSKTYINSHESAFPQFEDYVKDFLDTTCILPYGKIEERIVSIEHPGEGLSSDLVFTLEFLSAEDKELLMKHVVLNCMFGVTNFDCYDWGYWTDVYGSKREIPYASHISDIRIVKTPYQLFGVSPAISVLSSTVKEPCLHDIFKQMIDAIAEYEKVNDPKRISDIARWSAFNALLRKSANEISHILT